MATYQKTKNQKRPAASLSASDIVGDHPITSCFLSGWLSPTDSHTDFGVPHRLLFEQKRPSKKTVAILENLLKEHHVSDEKLKRVRRLQDVLNKRGFKATATGLRAFPRNDKTRKGNFAEVFLSEYLNLTGKGKTLVYRLRFNPNVEQSMKGDDVLAFNFDRTIPEIVVGEAKFRATPTKAVVEEMLNSLEKAYKIGVPMSLQFVTDRLYEMKSALADRVMECSILILERKLVLNYAGLVISGSGVEGHVQQHCRALVPRSAIISVALEDGSVVIKSCFEELERKHGFDPH